MKNLILLLLTILSLLPVVNAQEQHTYGPIKENYFQTVFRDNHPTGDHKVGVSSGFEIRNFNFWTWERTDFPLQAELTSINIRFKAYRFTNDKFDFGLYAVPIEWVFPQQWFSFLNNDDYLVYKGSLTPTNNIVSFDSTFSNGDLFNAINNAIHSNDYYFTLWD